MLLAATSQRFVMEQIVNGSPDGQVRYHVVVEADQTRVSAGPAERPDITFTTDYATAAAVAQGQLSTHAALMDGRMRVGGDLTRIVDAPPDWSDLDPLPAALRAETTY
jgi:putative sterol carrier protein